jgi:hypothetical protein
MVLYVKEILAAKSKRIYFDFTLDPLNLLRIELLFESFSNRTILATGVAFIDEKLIDHLGVRQTPGWQPGP